MTSPGIRASQESVATELLSQSSAASTADVKPLDIVPTAAEREFTQRSLVKRPIPPLSGRDTIRVAPGMPLESEHGIGKIFENYDIVCIFPSLETTDVGLNHDLRQRITFAIQAHKTRLGYWVIQQQNQRGCTGGCTNMLRKDHGKKVDLQSLFEWNCRKPKLIIRNLEEVGLTVVVTEIGKRDLNGLEQRVHQRGSAMVELNGSEFGSHSIIVDEIAEQNALIREPYHGWQLLVEKNALQWHLSGGEIFQIDD